jgi:hypothetical protein
MQIKRERKSCLCTHYRVSFILGGGGELMDCMTVRGRVMPPAMQSAKPQNTEDTTKYMHLGSQVHVLVEHKRST